MEEELQELKDLIVQLKAYNDRLRQEWTDVQYGPNLVSTPPPPGPLPGGPSVTIAERLVFVPRDRKCPYFSGKSGISISEWVEEAQACMRARHLSTTDQAFFLLDHLEGEAREEIKYRSGTERGDPKIIIAILQDLYGCSQSYVALQEAFFCRKQQEGETLQEFSLALMSLMEKVKRHAPAGLLNADVLLRDQFTEHVLDSALRRELKQLVRRQPTITLLEVRGEAIRWEREGMPGGARGRSQSVSSVYGNQYGVYGGSRPASHNLPQPSEFTELKEILKRQQDQINQLTQSMALLQNPYQPRRPPCTGPIICRSCQQPGHIAKDCDGQRVSPHTQPPPSFIPPSSGSIPSQPQAPTEN